MSDQQKAVLSLTLVLETCNAALDSIAPHPSLQSPDVLHKDLVSLFSLLYAATTKVSLTLKPSHPTYSASLTPLKDLADHVSALFHCASYYVPEAHGATLVQEVVSLVRDAIESIRALVQKFLEIEANESRQSSGQAGDEYMVRTATVHNVLDRARGLSANNLLAVRKRWVEDAASLVDGFREVADMVEDAESTENPEDLDDTMFDDGWGEIGLGKGQKMDLEELERTKKVGVSVSFFFLTVSVLYRFTEYCGSPNCYTSESFRTSSRHPGTRLRTIFWTPCHLFHMRCFPLPMSLSPLCTPHKIRGISRQN
jgi:hypothetical protein